MIEGPQQAEVTAGGAEVLNMCAQQLSRSRESSGDCRSGAPSAGPLGIWPGKRPVHLRHPDHSQAAGRADLSAFLGTEDTILYGSCFDANGGLFETLLEAEDAVISDELNHASIIDGVRLCKAARFRYRNGDMDDLETKLKEASGARHRLIATDGVFSMDGYIAKLRDICDLADKYRRHGDGGRFARRRLHGQDRARHA